MDGIFDLIEERIREGKAELFIVEINRIEEIKLTIIKLDFI